MLTRLDEIAAVCPAVALQAILLKLEDNIVVQPGAFEALMSRYTLILHQATGLLLRSLNYYDKETLSFTMYPYNYGNLT